MTAALVVAGAVAYLAIGVLLVRVSCRYSRWARDVFWDEVSAAFAVAMWPLFAATALFVGLGFVLARLAGVNR